MGISEEDKPWQAKPRWTICLILLLTFSAPKQIHYSLKSIWKKQWKTFEFFFYIILPRRRRERSLEVLNKKDEESKREIVSCQRWNQTEFVPSQLGCNSVLWLKLLKPPPVLNGLTSAKTRLLLKLVCQAVVYLTWKEQNIRRHGVTASTPPSLFKQLDRVIRDTLLARKHRKGCVRLLSLWFTHSWAPLDANFWLLTGFSIFFWP